MKFGVVRFPGSCDEIDALLACRRFGDAELLWHKDRDLDGVDAVVVPGGFSYGDYLRAGAIARFSPLMETVIEFARAGGPVLGICNGFQVLRYAPGQNPNGAQDDIAGVCNAEGNVLGLMPHPEHAVDPLTGSADGGRLFESVAMPEEPGSAGRAGFGVVPAG